MYEEFRKCYAELGLITELLIGNMVVGNFTLRDACAIADALMKSAKLGRYK